jgi:FkbM family methyltransferase
MVNIKMLVKTDWEKWRAKTFAVKEPETLAWINDFDGGVFWDIGANVGIYSLYCAHKHPKMKIHAFEPMRNNFLRLWQNIFMNDFYQITAHHACVGDETDGYCYFAIKSDVVGSSGGQAVVNLAAEKNDNGYTVPIHSGDWLCWSANYQTPNYVKIDTDGNEYDVLTGMGNILIDDDLKSVLVEVNNSSGDIDYLMKTSGFVPDEKYNRIKNRESDFNVIFTKK